MPRPSRLRAPLARIQALLEAEDEEGAEASAEYAASLAYRSVNDTDNAARCIAAYQDWIRRAASTGDLKANQQGGGIPSGMAPMDDDD